MKRIVRWLRHNVYKETAIAIINSIFQIVQPWKSAMEYPAILISAPDAIAMNIIASNAVSAANMPPVMRHVTEWLWICDNKKLLIIGMLK